VKRVLIIMISIVSMTLGIEAYAINFGGAGKALGGAASGSVSRGVGHSVPHSAPQSGAHTPGPASKTEPHSTNGGEAGKTEKTKSNSKIVPVPKNYNSQNCTESDRRTGRNGCN